MTRFQAPQQAISRLTVPAMAVGTSSRGGGAQRGVYVGRLDDLTGVCST
jgi:hypothetical protein